MEYFTKEEIEPVIEGVISFYLIPRFRELGMPATGEWEENIHARSNEVWGRDYTEQLARGREPGSMPPVEAIQRWALAKFGNGDINVAWAIAKKIEQEGTTWYPEGSDVLEVLESRDVLDFITYRLQQLTIEKVQTQFRNEFNRA